VASVLRRLLEQQLIAEADPEDRRAYAVTITASGRRALTKAEKTVPEYLERTFAALSPTERDQLTTLLGKLLAAS